MALSVALLAALNAALSRLGSGTVQVPPPVIEDPPDPPDPGEDEQRIVNVTNQSQLNAAIADLQPGDMIDLVYNATPYNLDMTSKAPSSEVAFRMKPGESTAPVIAELDLVYCANLRFEKLRWAATGTISGTTDEQTIAVNNCTGLTFSECEVDGAASTYWNGSTGLGWSAMRFQDCIGITVEKCHIHHVGWGVRFFSCANVTVGGEALEDGNVIERMQKDGLFFVGQTGAVVVRNNRIGKPLATDHANNHGDLFQIATSGATAPVGPFTVEDNVFATLGTYAYQGFYNADEAGVGIVGFNVRRNVVQTANTIGFVIRSIHGGEVEANIVIRDPNAATIPGIGTYGTPLIYALDTYTGLSDVECHHNASQAYSGMGTSGLNAHDNVTISNRNDWISGVDSFTSLDAFLTAETPAGYGPSWMQAA